MVISQEIYESLGRPNQTLEKSSNILYAPTRQPLDMLGQFFAKLTHGSNTFIENAFMVKGHKCNLLGFPAISAMDLIQRVLAACSDDKGHTIRLKFIRRLCNLGEEDT